MASEQEILSLYERHCEGVKKVGQSQYQALCPFHDDTHHSFGFNTEYSTYNCFTCDNSGNAVKFAKHFGDNPKPFYSNDYVPLKTGNKRSGTNGKQTGNGLNGGKTEDYTVKQQNNSKDSTVVIPSSIGGKTTGIKDYTDKVNQYHYEWANSDAKTMNRVGMCNGHMTFPYFDSNDICIGIHHHKSAPHWEGHRTCKWYNEWMLPYMDKKKPLVICEGEPDACTLTDADINAVCGSAGSKSIPKYFPKEFNEFPEIIVLQDNDEWGRKGALRIAEAIYRGLGILVSIAKWRDGLPDKFDPSSKNGIKETMDAINKREKYEIEIPKHIGEFEMITDVEGSNTEPKPTEWLIEGILPKEFNSVLSGTTGAKKSYLAMCMGMCLANGEASFLNRKIKTTGIKVLYVDTEIGKDEYLRRYHRIKKNMIWRDNGNWYAITKSGSSIDIWEYVHQYAEGIQPDLIIIDSLYNTTTLDDLSKPTNMSKVTNELTLFKKAYDSSLLVVSHFNKGGDEMGLNINRMSGSSVFQNWVEWVILTTNTNVENFNLFQIAKARGEYHDKTVLGLKFDKFWFTALGVVEDWRHFLISDGKKAKWMGVLDDCPNEFDTNLWLNVFNAKHETMNERTGRAWLSECSKTPMIEKISHGLYKKGLGLITQENVGDIA